MLDAVKSVENWGLPMPGMFLCAGPCSAESEEQLRQTASQLAGGGLSFFRAGVWKPRTHPGAFAGAGERALDWLVRIREEFALPIGVEVGTPQHAEAALRHGLDVIWIGARTSPDPFAVQSIADALRGSDVAVLVKNPVSQDIEAWLGALERMYNAGIRRLGAIHRGFTTSGDTRYRNVPLWRIPIELKRRLPNLAMICDPSHMCGRIDLIAPTAQEALDLLYDGIMVEVHHRPAEALSDAAQQLTPTQFHSMMSQLLIRKEAAGGPSFESQMHKLRRVVDDIDDGIIDMLARRMEVVRQMGELKRRHRVSTLQPTRWQEILASRINSAGRKGLGEEFISQIYEMIHEEAIRQQEEPLFRDAHGEASSE